MKFLDAVELNSGGPLMRIIDIFKYGGQTYYQCVWINNGVFNEKTFNALTVKPYFS